LCTKLSTFWKSLRKWGITSLDKNFYDFSFSSLDDVKSVRVIASWNLSLGYLKLFAWSCYFNPQAQQQSTSQVLVWNYDLSHEYWRPKILYAIASMIGTPFCVDDTFNKSKFDRPFGHFGRVLVDTDLKESIIDKILFERKRLCSFFLLNFVITAKFLVIILIIVRESIKTIWLLLMLRLRLRQSCDCW